MGRRIYIGTASTPAAATVDTVDLGFLSSSIMHGGQAMVNAALIAGANEVRATQFVLLFRITIGQLSFHVTTLDVGKFVGTGIYSADRNTLLLESGGVSTTTTGVKVTALGTPVTLEPGIYWQADTTDSTVVQMRKVSMTSMDSLLNSQTLEKMGIAANTSTAGALPATLGAITAAAQSPLYVIYER